MVTVVYMLLSVVRVKEQEKMLEEKLVSLCKSEDHFELFEVLDPYLDYLSYDLLDMLLEKVTPLDDSFQSVRSEMDLYKQDLQEFRKRTSLELYCQIVPYEKYDHLPNFRKLVVAHRWPNTVTLEDVQMFGEHVTEHSYMFQKLAMMVNSVLEDLSKEDTHAVSIIPLVCSVSIIHDLYSLRYHLQLLLGLNRLKLQAGVHHMHITC